MEEIFGRRGLLARSHPDYEYRQGQLAMASAVRAALEKRHHLLVEAGTGTGKTLAYLIPAIANGKRVIVSTGTKNLQEQLYYKDIPFLQKVLPRQFRATYLKGRSNYLCLQRFRLRIHRYLAGWMISIISTSSVAGRRARKLAIALS
jgi:ATP-dependent DNA helicase DinG